MKWSALEKIELLYRGGTGCRDLKKRLECCEDEDCAWVGKDMSKNFPCRNKAPNVIDSCPVNPVNLAFNEFLEKIGEKKLEVSKNFDITVVYEQLFKPLIGKQTYTEPCKDAIKGWIGPMGQMNYSGRPTIRSLLYTKQEEGKRIFQNMYQCASVIDIPQKILFRGVPRDFERSTIERMTATSMSLGTVSGTYSNGPLVLLYVPNQKVFGLVISAFDSGRTGDKDSEILLLNPHVQELKDESIRSSLVSKLDKINKKYESRCETDPEYIYIYEYLGYFPEEKSKSVERDVLDDDFKIKEKNENNIQETLGRYADSYYI